MKSIKNSNKSYPIRDYFQKVPHLKLACLITLSAILIILFVAAASGSAISRVKKLEKDIANHKEDDITSMTSTTVEPDIYGMMDDYMDAYELKNDQSISEKIKNSMTGVSAEEVNSQIKDALKGYLSSNGTADLVNNSFSSYNTTVDRKIEEINQKINENTEKTTNAINELYVKTSSNSDDISTLDQKIDAHKKSSDASISSLKQETTKQISDTQTSLEKNISDIQTKFEDSMSNLQNNLEKRIADVKQELDDNVYSLTEMINALSERFDSFSSSYNEFITNYNTFVTNYNTSIDGITERLTVVENKSQIVISPTEPEDHDVLWIVPCG